MEVIPDNPKLAAFMDPLRELVELHVAEGNIEGVTLSVLYGDDPDTRYRTYDSGLCLADAVFGLALAMHDVIDNCPECGGE